MTNELAIRIITGDVLGTTEQTQEAVTMAVRALSQPEITEDDVKEFCRKRCLIVVTSDLYDEMIRRWASAEPEQTEREGE